MKKKNLFVFTALTVFSLLLSACGATPASTSANTVGAKVDASPTEFTGIVEAIEEDQITVDGQVITVSPEILASGSFTVGDTVEVEASTDENGDLVAESVELHNDDSNDDLYDDSSDDMYDDSDDDMYDDSSDDMYDDSDDDMDDDSDDDMDDDSDDDMDDDSSDDMDDDSDDDSNDDNSSNDSSSDSSDENNDEDDGDETTS